MNTRKRPNHRPNKIASFAHREPHIMEHRAEFVRPMFQFYDSLLRLGDKKQLPPGTLWYDKILQSMRLIHFNERWKDCSAFSIKVKSCFEDSYILFSVYDVASRRSTMFGVFRDSDDIFQWGQPLETPLSVKNMLKFKH